MAAVDQAELDDGVGFVAENRLTHQDCKEP
jgi:hypothetical protein